MKPKIIIWTTFVMLVLLIANVDDGRIGMQLIAFLLNLAPRVLLGCVLAIHIALGFFVWRDARARSDLLLGIPPWVWGLIGLTAGLLGLAVHWLANCSSTVRKRTIPVDTYRE